MIEFRCDNCGRKLSIPESNAGKKGRCPKCKRIVFIPGAQKSDSPPLQENSDESKDGPRYSAFDLTLLEVPKIGEAQEKQTGESDKAAEPKDRITQTPEQSDEELVVERKFPWPIDIFLFPASRSGLVILDYYCDKMVFNNCRKKYRLRDSSFVTDDCFCCAVNMYIDYC